MQRLMDSVVKRRKTVLIVFGILVVLAAMMLPRVRVNYNIQDYLPKDQPSVKAVDKLKKEFDMSIPNARAVFPAKTFRDGLIIKEKLEQTEGVRQVIWLDDTLDPNVPLEMADPKTVENFLNGKDALFQITAETDNALRVLDRIYALDPAVKVSGQLVDLANAQSAVQSEMLSITMLVIPIVLVILLLTTHAWLEPFVFMVAIGVGIILNMGTNALLGEISFITQAVGAVIQLAVSMDYAIFLLNRFNEHRNRGEDAETAMANAMRKAVVAISSSAMTTVFGFLALIFMRFGLGSDLGLVMAKGIFFSFFSVMFFMPCFLLMVYKLIDKTTHRPLLPDFTFMGRFVLKARWPIVILALVLVWPMFKSREKNDFIYGMGEYPRESRVAQDKIYINNEFGEQSEISLLLPRGDIRAEQRIQQKLEAEPLVSSVISYVGKADPAIPAGVVDPNQISMLISDHYSQFIITAEVPAEGDKAFYLAERLREIAAEEYGNDYYLTGINVITLDMKTTIEADDIVVNGLAVLAIALVIALAFRSVTLPFILVLTIELAIWMNLSVPYFTGSKLSYIGYLIISTVQLGATVDYAILYTEHYLDNRGSMGKREAVIRSSRETIPSLLPPAMILTASGIALQMSSSLAIVSELGEVLGRGAILSFFMVVLLLPCELYFLDFLVTKTTWKYKFIPADSGAAESLDGRKLLPTETEAGEEAKSGASGEPSEAERSSGGKKKNKSGT